MVVDLAPIFCFQIGVVAIINLISCFYESPVLELIKMLLFKIVIKTHNLSV